MTTIPSHLSIARLEHAIVRTERELYVAHETGRHLTEEELQLRLDMMNRVWMYYHHNHTQASYTVNETDGRERA